MTNKRRGKKTHNESQRLLDLHTHLQYASALITRDEKSSRGIHSSARKMLHHFMRTVKGAEKHIGPKPLICVHSARDAVTVKTSDDIFILIKASTDSSSHTDGGMVILEEAAPVRLEIFHRIKVMSQNSSVLIFSDPSL